jgi:O-succinylbenzoic acid--CoA ligase
VRIFVAPGSPALEIGPELTQKANRLAAAHGEGKRFFVLAESDNRKAAEWIMASFLSPLIIVPIAPSLPKEARDRVLAQLPDSWVEEKDLPLPAAQASSKPLEEIWAVIFSSGSSGEPKGIALSGRALRSSAEAHARHSGNSHWLLNLPLHHVGGFSVLSRAHFLGGEVSITATRFDSVETAAWLEKGEVRGLSLVPTTLSRLLETNADFTKVETVLLGGAPAEPALVERALKRSLPMRLTYGMTEHSSQIATEKAAGSGMIPLPGVEIRISGDGEILVRSPCLASGIFRGGQLEPLPGQDGFFATGDLGRFDGNALVLEGRKSDMIISGGVKVFPLEIESLLSLPGLRDCAITSVPDAEWGERVCAALVGDISPDTVKSYLAEKIDGRKMPKSWVSLSHIPRSATGKILRSELRRLVKEKLDWANR